MQASDAISDAERTLKRRDSTRPYAVVSAVLATLYQLRFLASVWWFSQPTSGGNSTGTGIHLSYSSLPQGLLLTALAVALYKGQARWLASVAVLAPLAVVVNVVQALIAPSEPFYLLLMGAIVLLWLILAAMVWRAPGRQLWRGG